MTRTILPGLESPAPLAARLPGVYQSEFAPNFGQRFLSALDDVLAPVFLALDNMPAYLDPMLTPRDFLDWLAGWLGLVLDERWSDDQKRVFVARMTKLHQLRGTAEGVRQHVEAYSGVRHEVEDSGGVAWSTTAGSPLPGEDSPRLTVRVPAGHGLGKDDKERLRALIEAIMPAHVALELDVAE